MDSVQPAAIDIKMIPVGNIELNDYNPNAMEQELFEILTEQVKAEGMIQPILVRPKASEGTIAKYVAVDGEHRYRASVVAGLPEVACVVMTYTDDEAKLKTVAMNHIRGEYVPMKMAKLMVDLQDRFDPTTIRRMTGMREEELQTLADLMEVPDINLDGAPTISVDSLVRPIPVNLLLMPDEHGSWHEAMVKAMELSVGVVTPLVAEEVGQYDNAMTTAMGLTGVKMRNVGLATICRVFNALDKDTKEALVAQVAKKFE